MRFQDDEASSLTFPLAGRYGLALLMDAVRGDLDRSHRVFALFARAVLAGGSARREAALTDGWGSPAEWLRAAERYFRVAEVPAVAGACRALLRRTDVRPGAEVVPPALRAAGITLREYEVLRLLGKRLRNKEIAERLHLSQRTVETHVSSLLAKTGLPDRIELSKFATGA